MENMEDMNARNEELQIPQWLRAFMENQQAQNQRQQEQAQRQQAAIEQLSAQIQLNQAGPSQATPPAYVAPQGTPTTNTPDVPDVRRPKPRLTDPDRFDGKDLTLYPQFEGKLLAKLEIDGPSIGGIKEQIWYGFGRLEKKAAARIYPWMSTYKETTSFQLDLFLQQLRTAFQDPAQQQKALRQLNTVKQGLTPLPEFLSEFDRLILEAGGQQWDDGVKKEYLNQALNYKLLEKIIGTEEKAVYEDYCQQVRTIHDQMMRVKDRTKGSYSSAPRQPSPPPQNDAMDWQPTGSQISAVRTERAQWVDQRVMDQRRERRQCYRCGSSDHGIRDCQLLPARRPPSQRTVVSSVQPKEEDRNGQEN